MYKKIQYIALFMAMIAVSNPANAENIKVYTGIGMGGFSTDYGSTAATGNLKTDAKFGSYLTISADFNPYFAVEFRYGFVSKATLKSNGVALADQSITISNLSSLLLKPQFPLKSYGHVYALFGTTSAGLDYQTAGRTTTTKTSGLSYGIGFKIHLFDTWAVGADYTRYTNKQDFINNKARITGFSATINYMFD